MKANYRCEDRQLPASIRLGVKRLPDNSHVANILLVRGEYFGERNWHILGKFRKNLRKSQFRTCFQGEKNEQKMFGRDIDTILELSLDKYSLNGRKTAND